MRIAAVRHVAFEHLGRISAVLEARGIEYRYLDLWREPEAECSHESFDGLIVLGGPMSANDNLDYIRRELRLIEEVLSSGKPALGICLGAQLIAKAAGAKIERNPVKEIGWRPIYRTEEGRTDALLGGLNQAENVFHWHGETFEIPHGAEWLAWSDDCRHQAYRLGNAYGMQFHLEVTPEMVSDWLGQEMNCGDVAGLEERPDPRENSSRLSEAAGVVFGRWCDLLNGTGGLLPA